MTVECFEVVLGDGAVLLGDRYADGVGGVAEAPAVVLLHAAVADRRSWSALGRMLAERRFDVLAYDRRGFGESAAAAVGSDFTHLDDLLTLLDDRDVAQAIIVGNSMGGALALDCAARHPHRVAGVVLLGAGVSGMTDEDCSFSWQPDAASDALLERIAAAEAAGDRDAQAEALAELWLDGPENDPGRVGGVERQLFLDMNRRILEVGAPDGAGDGGFDTWAVLGDISVPVLTSWGEFDLPCDLPLYEETARRLAQGPGRVLPGTAHLPSLETPHAVADLVAEVGRLRR